MKAISTIAVLVVGLGILTYAAGKGISTGVVPSLDTRLEGTLSALLINATSTTDAMATSTDSGAATSSDLSVVDAPASAYSDFRVGEAVFRVTTAKTPSTREKGLSGRAGLDHDEGLLFIFPEPGAHGFWMKDMNFPIDIVWMDRYLKVIGVTDNISPDTYPELFLPPSDVQFVLEVNAGAADAAGIEEGDYGAL